MVTTRDRIEIGGNRTKAMDVTKVGIVGLGRWAKVLTRAASKSKTLRIVSAYSRSQEKRDAFAHEFGVAAVPDLAAMLADPAIGHRCNAEFVKASRFSCERL